ncbi:MAG TPA: sodium-independent anion transporter [Candidatus Solibacter sp.]|nr:sodium-independent anion transporter [Candidatus Solibacter sp.]
MDTVVALPSLMICRVKVPLSYTNAELFMNEVLSIIRTAPSRLQWFILRFDCIGEVDYVAARMLTELADRIGKEQVALIFASLSPNLRGFFADFGVLEVIGLERVFASVDEAIIAFRNLKLNAKQMRKMS